jgi:hypothetical protein
MAKQCSKPVVGAKEPGLSPLPGDIKYDRPNGNIRLYFPIVTPIVPSVVLTLIFRVFN